VSPGICRICPANRQRLPRYATTDARQMTVPAESLAKPRLWVVSELYYPEQTSTGYFLTRIAEGLADDFDVQVISGLPTYSERDVAVASRETRNGTLIHRMRGTRFAKDNLAGRLLNLITFTASLFWFALRRLRRGDRVLVVTNPPSAPVLMLLASRLKGALAVQLVHDVYPDILHATGLLRKDSWLYRVLDRFFGQVARGFRRVIVLGRDMRTLYEQRLGDRAANVVVIPNWGDIDEVIPQARMANPFRAAHGWGTDVTIQFSGNIGRTHDIESLLEVAGSRRGQPGLRFVFIGYGGKSSLVEQACADRDLDNVQFLPRQPREMLGPMLASADAVVIGFVDKMLGLSVPSRMYNVMAAGTPIIAMAHPDSELALTIEEADCGWVIATGDAVALGAIIDQLRTPEGLAQAQAKGARGRALVEKHYSFEAILHQYRDLLTRLG
jgi:glycosyltransferase involved in cell wall biosynthesis